MVEIAFEKAAVSLRRGQQVMVFVHARKDTSRTANSFRDIAAKRSCMRLLVPSGGDSDGAAGAGGPALSGTVYGSFQKQVDKSRNKELRDLFAAGMGMHHAVR